MLSSSKFEDFKVQFYKGRYPGQRFGQAFVNHSGYVQGPNPILFYDPDNVRAEDYIRRNYVYSVVTTWQFAIPATYQYMFTDEGIKHGIEIQLLMSEQFHQLFNVTRSDVGEEKRHDQLIEVMAFDRGACKFIYSNSAPCDGDLIFCEVVE